MNNRPWYIGVLFGVLALAQKRYPEYKDLIEALIFGLGGGMATTMISAVKNGNGNRNGGTNGGSGSGSGSGYSRPSG